jgi:hypothetical protein
MTLPSLDQARQHWNAFWFTPGDTIRLDTFRVIMGLCLLIYILLRWSHAGEWLTQEGFHFSPEAAFWYSPITFPPLPIAALPWFGLVFFGSIIGMIFGWRLRWTTWITLICFLYVNYTDRISAFTINKLFIVSLTVLALAPMSGRGAPKRGQSLKQPVWAIRVLQSVILIQYFTAGMCKFLNGDWSSNPYILWSQVQGIYCTDIASWMLYSLPKWTWAVQQYAAAAFEIGAPLLFGIRRLRPLAYIWGIGFHLIIALTMHDLIYFSLQLVCFYVLFMDDENLRRVHRTLARTFGIGRFS